MAKPKLGGDELTASFQKRLEETIEQKFNGFKAENDRKYKDYIVSLDPILWQHFIPGNNCSGKFHAIQFVPQEIKVNPHNGQLATELFERVKSRVFEGADHAGPDAVHAHLHNIFNGERQTALNEVVNLQFTIHFFGRR